MSDYEPNASITKFYSALARLDDGERARLKRCAGKSLAEVNSAVLALFYKLLPTEVMYERDIGVYYLVATLYPLAKGGGQGNFGAAMRRIRPKKEHEGLDRRMKQLLDADETELPFRLRQAIRFLDDKDGRVNWPSLLSDLLWWNHEERRVQLRWARSYFGEPSSLAGEMSAEQ